MLVSQTIKYFPRHYNTAMVSSRASFTSWGEDASLALVDHLSSDGVTIKIPYEVDVLLQLFLLGWLKLNLTLLLDQLRLAYGDECWW